MLAGAALGIVGVVSGFVEPMLFGVALLAFPMVTIGIYRDAIYVRLNSDWRPNPVNHFLIALFAAVLAIPGFLYFGYYGYKRHANLGLI